MKTIIYIISIVLAFFSVCQGANYSLQIVYPIAAGTGTPVIPSTHPIFRAYPGIPYNIRPHIQGGAYPYTFALSGQPAGMTIDASTGEISWPSPDTTTGTITLTVTDSESSVEESTWVVTVSTSDYLFVDDTYVGTETGSITQPFSTIQNLFDGSSSTTAIVYFRTGTYHLPVHNPIDGLDHDCVMDTESAQWLGYPGETATIDMDANYFQGGNSYYLDSLTFIDIPDWFIHEVISDVNYVVIRRNDISGARCVYRTMSNNNQGLYYTSHGNRGNYLTIQDNLIHNFDDVHGVGSLYEQDYVLVEDNAFYDFTTGTGYLGGGPVIAPKWNGTRQTYRHNNIYNIAARQGIGGGTNGMFRAIEGVEILYNRIKTTSAALYFNNDANGNDAGDDLTPPSQRQTNVYRNTIEGYIVMNNFTSETCEGITGGPWVYNNNIIINANSYGDDTNVANFTYRNETIANPENCITDTSNLKGVVADGIVDSSGLLQGAYRDTYLGVAGWELGEADTTAPSTTISTSDPTATTTGNVTVEGTSSDAVGVSGCKWRLASAPDASNGTACTGTTSFSCAVSGLSVGANTAYVGCYDAAGNYGSDSLTVNYSVPTPRLNGARPSGARLQ